MSIPRYEVDIAVDGELALTVETVSRNTESAKIVARGWAFHWLGRNGYDVSPDRITALGEPREVTNQPA